MEEIRFDPIERKEFFLAKLGGQEVTPPDAVTRIERYLQDIIDGNASTIPPVTRIEYYLAKISGADVEVPDPATRTEYYLAKIAGMDVEQPDPITRLDYFLAQWIETGGGVLETVTGNAPITLANALAKAIVSLTQYGLCTQASTPTPSSPVDIKCNNGVLKLVDDELPAGFKRLASIKFDGDFWYETGEVMTGNDDVTMTLSGTVTTGQNVFGSYNGTETGTKNFSLYLYGGGSTSNCYLRYGEQLLRPRFGSGDRTITFGKSGTSGFYTDVTAEPDTFTTVAGAFIGMLPNSSSPAYTGSIVGNILVGTRLKWIPCERESDGVVGYYEAVKGVFLEPVGTGTPVKGAYDFSLTHIDAVGTPEVLTVTDEDSNAQTASVVDLFAVGDYKDEQDIISGLLTHRVGIIVLDGTEDWSVISGTFAFRIGDSIVGTTQSFAPLSTHFVGADLELASMPNNSVKTGNSRGLSGYAVFVKKTNSTDVAAFKSFLASEYAAGTPVIMVYPLAEATTDSVEEQSLSTVEGTNVVNVTAEVSPIELEAEYMAVAP